MTPKELITNADLKKKQRYFKEGRMTNHWPHRIHVFSKEPFLRTPAEKEKYRPFIDRADCIWKEPLLTDVGKRLAGF